MANRGRPRKIKSLVEQLPDGSVKMEGGEFTVNPKIQTVSSETLKEEIPNLDTIRQEVVPGTERIIETIHGILGNAFNIQLVPFGLGGLQVTIISPPEYDSRPDSHKEFFRYEERSQVIPIIGGMDELKKWCEKIKKNIRIKYPAFAS